MEEVVSEGLVFLGFLLVLSGATEVRTEPHFDEDNMTRCFARKGGRRIVVIRKAPDIHQVGSDTLVGLH